MSDVAGRRAKSTPFEDTSTKAKYKSYESKEWSKGYDLVIHDECSANVTEPDYVNNILDAHRNGVPAVNLHCAMHSFRWGNFREPVEALGPYGFARRVRTVDLQLDEPGRFDALLGAAHGSS